jgi:HSP20 family protein
MTTGLIRWNPEADLIRGRFDRVFNQMLNDLWGSSGSEDVAQRSFLPAVDVRETPDALVFSAELPGLKKEEVRITLENQVLTLSGERKRESDKKDDKVHRIERSYGSFSRSFTLPANVRAADATAGFENGVLTVTIPKVEAPKPRQIEIK